MLAQATSPPAALAQHACAPVVVVQECERRELQQQQGAFMSEVEQWSQGEVEAIQAAADARVKGQQQAVELW